MHLSSNQNPYINREDKEVDIKEIISMLLKYKKSIIFIIVLATTIGALVALKKDNVYQAELSMKIQSAVSKSENDFIEAAIGMSPELGNEILLLRSRFMAKKVLENLELGNRYYNNSSYKRVEIYTSSPFKVNVKSITNRIVNAEFHLSAISETRFILKLELPAAQGFEAINYERTHKFGEDISDELFQFSIDKSGNLRDQKFIFTLSPNYEMYTSIQKSLSISVVPESSMVLLKYSDTIPQRAQDILNTLAKVYTEQVIQNKKVDAQRTLSFIDSQLEEINKELDLSATDLQSYKSQRVMMNVETKAEIASTSLNKHEVAMSELTLQASTLKNLLNYIHKNKKIIGIDLSVLGDTSTTLENLLQRIQEADTYKSSLLVAYTDKHPSVLKVNQELSSLKENLIGTIEGSLRTIQHRKSSLYRMIRKYSASLASLPEEEKKLTELNRNFKINQSIYEYLLERRAETAIIHASSVSDVRIIDDALSNGIPTQPNRKMILGIGIVLGLIFGIFQAFLRNILSNRILNVSDIESKTTLPIYSILPQFKNKKSLYKEALRTLLTRLEYQKETTKIITLTSSIKGEGKTTTSLELANIIGKTGKKVIVLDMDLRSSKINNKLQLAHQDGIANYLLEEVELENIIQPINTNTDIIVSGPQQSDAYEMIMSDKFKKLLEELKSSYDYILLESPPLGLVADALILMRLSTFNLILFKINYSQKTFIDNINRLLYEHNIKNIGIVINALELNKIRPWVKK